MLHAAVELLKEQETVLERLNACARNATQPVFRVPDEILSNIFEVGTPGSSDHWDADWSPRLARTVQLTPTQYMSQLASIGATCSRFREVVVNTPRCWTYVTFIASGLGTKLAALETMVARSKSCKFTLRLELRAKSFSPSTYTRHAIASILLPHMNRCQALLFVSHNLRDALPNTIPMTSLQNVRHLAFDWSGAIDLDIDNEGDENAGQSAEESVHSLIAAIATPLQSIAITRHTSQVMLRDFENINSQCLTRLRLNVCAPMAHVIQLLQRCLLLEHLDWTVDSERDDTRELTLSLKNLVSLRIHNAERFGGLWILDTPCLEQIDLTGANENLPFDITNHFQAALPSLARVALSEYSFAGHLAPFLLRHPLLSECVLDMSGYGDDDVDDICGALECLLAPFPGTTSIQGRHLQRLSLAFDSGTFVRNHQQIKCSLVLVMTELAELHVDVHGVFIEVEPATVTDVGDVGVSARLSFNPAVSLLSRWPNAWGEF